MRTIYFVVLPNIHLLDLVGVAHVFYEAELLGCDYKREYISLDSSVSTSLGLDLTNLKTLEGVSPENDDIIIVPGIAKKTFRDHNFVNYQKSFFSWLNQQSTKGTEICGICSGAFILAKAGLLNNKKCTTHWRLIDELKENIPGIKIINEVIFITDQNITTSAGVTSGIDLALSIVEKDYGPLRAAEITKEMVVYIRRNSNVPQKSIYLQYHSHFNKSIHELQDWISNNISGNLDLTQLSDIACMSERNLTRTFKKATGVTIGKYISQLRLEMAKTLLFNPELSIDKIADKCGFQSARQLKRVWNKYEEVPFSRIIMS